MQKFKLVQDPFTKIPIYKPAIKHILNTKLGVQLNNPSKQAKKSCTYSQCHYAFKIQYIMPTSLTLFPSIEPNVVFTSSKNSHLFSHVVCITPATRICEEKGVMSSQHGPAIKRA